MREGRKEGRKEEERTRKHLFNRGRADVHHSSEEGEH